MCWLGIPAAAVDGERVFPILLLLGCVKLDWVVISCGLSRELHRSQWGNSISSSHKSGVGSEPSVSKP